MFRVCCPPLLRSPPPLPADVSVASFSQRRRYVVHQLYMVRRLAGNPHLTEGQRREALEQAEFMAGLLGAHPLLDDLSRCIEDTGRQVLGPLLAQLRDQARDRLEQSPDTTSREILSLFIGPLSGMERLCANRLTVESVIDRCTGFRSLSGD